MSTTEEFSFGEAETYASVDPDEVLSENKVQDLVEYSRGNMIKNEEQSIVTLLCWVTGWFAREDRYVNLVTIGTTGSGKTKKDREIKPLLPSREVYESTAGSDKAFVDDDSWDAKKVAVMSEWQKLGDEIKEFMKSVAGDDGGYEYTRNVPDPDGEKGDRKSKKITKDSKPYSFTYAQFSMDNEMWSRLLKVYIEEGRDINEAVSRMHAGHTNISMPSWEHNYAYDTVEIRSALQKHIRSIPEESYVHMPDWVYYAVKDVIDTRRSESKRVSAMVFNLIRSSALFNYDNRPMTTISHDGDEHEAYVVQPTDVANVLVCRETLLGTTHELEPRKLEVVEAVRSQCKMGSEEYVLLNDIQQYFESEKSNMSLLKKDTLRELLKELDENFIIDIEERYDGNAHGYKFLSLSQIGSPNLRGFEQFEYEEDEPFMGVENPDDPFSSVSDPIKAQPFKESVAQFESKVSEDVVDETDMKVSEAMSGSPQSGGDGSDGQATLGGGKVGSDEKPVIEGHVVTYIYNQLQTEADGETFVRDGLEHEHILGIVDVGESVVEADFSNSILDPDHAVWTPPGRGKSMVHSEGEAKAEVESIYRDLQDKNIVEYEATSDEELVVHVNEADVE